jgi:hypothetical protein
VKMLPSKGRCHKALINGIVFGLTGLIVLLPHWLSRWWLYGSPLDTGYREEFFWTDPRLLEVGLSLQHGMFLWTPVLLVALLGFVALWRRDHWWFGSLLLSFAVFYYTIAAYQNWHGQSAFGSRFFVSFTPVFVLGLANFLHSSTRLYRKKVFSPRPVVAVLLASLILWNVGLMFQWGTNIIPNRIPVDFTIVARNQVRVVPHRIVNFVTRYLMDRNQVVRDIEQGDLDELKGYRSLR